MHIKGEKLRPFSFLIAGVASMGGYAQPLGFSIPCIGTDGSLALSRFIFGYDTGQISDILLMDDFLLRFAQCGVPGDVATCEFTRVIEGLIVGLLSIGTLFGALIGAPLADKFGRRNAMSFECIMFTIGVLIQVTSFHAW